MSATNLLCMFLVRLKAILAYRLAAGDLQWLLVEMWQALRLCKLNFVQDRVKDFFHRFAGVDY